ILAKQLWRLLSKPDTLLTRILKAKYYPCCSILETKIRWRPSYILRSLMGAQNLIVYGSRWKIGLEEDVRIWINNLLPSLDNFEVQSYCPFVDREARVSTLID
ncbi:hypothetical protein LINGRAHAP2_LOCUS1793, partial [Linum grandiflorum]